MGVKTFWDIAEAVTTIVGLHSSQMTDCIEKHYIFVQYSSIQSISQSKPFASKPSHESTGMCVWRYNSIGCQESLAQTHIIIITRQFLTRIDFRNYPPPYKSCTHYLK